MRVLLATAFAMTTALDTRWDAATALLASTVPARRTRDHRAKHAVVIGAVDDLISAVQPGGDTGDYSFTVVQPTAHGAALYPTPKKPDSSAE